MNKTLEAEMVAGAKQGGTKHLPAQGDENHEYCRLKFDGSRQDSGCHWTIGVKDPRMVSLVQEMGTWANARVRLEGASAVLHTVEKEGVELKICGQGKDGRCHWCRAFRSGLKTAVRRKYGREAMVVDGACRFDQARQQASEATV